MNTIHIHAAVADDRNAGGENVKHPIQSPVPGTDGRTTDKIIWRLLQCNKQMRSQHGRWSQVKWNDLILKPLH